jgi:hypothetical protein
LFLKIIINSFVIYLFYFLFWTACMGQYFAHLPHSMHVVSSITGKPYPSCEIAPTGQTRVIGQWWFCGHAKGFIVRAIVDNLIKPDGYHESAN